LLNKVNSGGAHPCHLTTDRTGRWLFVANYTGGSVAVFPISEDGSLGGAAQVVEHAGASMADPARQEAPHAHSVDISRDNRFLYVCDLGLDQILIYAFDGSSGRLAPHGRVETARGAGPRHLAFAAGGTRAYVFNELDATITVYRVDGASGGLAALQTISTLPDGYRGRKWGAEIAVHPSGKFLWASNRAHDSIAGFRISPVDGSLTAIGRVAAQGVQPRHFALDPAGRFLHVANVDSGNVVPFRIDLTSGALEAAGPPVAVPEPVCVVFAQV
jgi:6-phosphogluconolactonase